ncbi:MAG TPA: hypothetical protein VI548_13015, partial [Chitinophagaceae bacterium]|nr:hypothetical protein [Chitinophagaceae bacterium]
EYKSLWQANKKYSWMKLRNGSLKDYVPSHYPLGFLLVNYGYEKYGAAFWKKVTLDAAAFKGLVYPFQKAVKKYAGVDFKTFRKDAFDFYKGPLQTSPNGGRLRESELNSDMQYKGVTQGTVNSIPVAGEIKISTPSMSHVTNYYFPFQLSDDSLLYVKSSYRRRSSFVLRHGGREQLLRVRDISFDEQYSVKNGRVVYAAYKADPRWGWRDYSEIKLLDIATGKQITLTHRSKYFSPDISADGNKIVAVQNAADGSSELHLLDAGSGEVLKRFSSAELSLFADPKFADDDKIVFAARLSDGRMSLMTVNTSNGEMEKLTPPSFSVIGFTNVNNGYVYYTASYFGNDEVYAFHLASRKIYKVTGSALGNYFVSADKDSLVFSSFSAEGYQLKKMSTAMMKFNEMNALSLQLPPPPVHIALADEYRNRQLSSIEGRKFPSSVYSKGTRLLNFHSWRPYYEDPEFSFSVYGENVLNTFQSSLYYLYNQNDRTNAVGFNGVFGGLFPYISFGTQLTFDRTDTTNGKNRKWNQLDSRIGYNIPLNFSGGRFYRYLNVGSSFILRSEKNTGPDRLQYPENDFSYLSHLLSYTQQVERARQHIFPRFGYSLSLQQRHAITKYKGYQFISSGSLYLPGILSVHHLVLNGSFQQRDTLRQLFSNRFAYSRGFNEFYFSRMWRLSANYHFPIWLPDWGFGNLLYIHRIRANGFYDFTKVYSRNKRVTADQRSAGLEFFFDTNWWNQYPLTFGVRISRLLDDDLATGNKGSVFEFILPLSIFPR